MSPLVFLLLLFAVFGVYGLICDHMFVQPQPRPRSPREEERLDTLEEVLVGRGLRGRGRR